MYTVKRITLCPHLGATNKIWDTSFDTTSLLGSLSPASRESRPGAGKLL